MIITLSTDPNTLVSRNGCKVTNIYPLKDENLLKEGYDFVVRLEYVNVENYVDVFHAICTKYGSSMPERDNPPPSSDHPNDWDYEYDIILKQEP